jgi:hypothetical protein
VFQFFVVVVMAAFCTHYLAHTTTHTQSTMNNTRNMYMACTSHSCVAYMDRRTYYYYTRSTSRRGRGNCKGHSVPPNTNIHTCGIMKEIESPSYICIAGAATPWRRREIKFKKKEGRPGRTLVCTTTNTKMYV